ncbi:hypothetical protein J7T55_009821 [Diaporthe amygdali]|uniref:uncharacterized protein n=1 Tax=Phomopsis amygdali TaxID=1214568 RepID=UPI0022FF1F35|nr:uncharacterized protein J7T55_009821 [Diaporthe amygdali]KAJ0116671.1 hypothetical protein J7T55_009821 [Diaporthe amygdali]
MSHIARLREEFDAKEHELQEREQTIASIRQVTTELEQQKKKLGEKIISLDNQQREILVLQDRLDALLSLEPTIDAAMRTKSNTEDVVKHVVENAIRSDHMTASEIVQSTLNTAMGFNGRTRSDNLDDIFIDLIDGDDSLKAAIESAMESGKRPRGAKLDKLQLVTSSFLNDSDEYGAYKLLHRISDDHDAIAVVRPRWTQNTVTLAKSRAKLPAESGRFSEEVPGISSYLVFDQFSALDDAYSLARQHARAKLEALDNDED